MAKKCAEIGCEEDAAVGGMCRKHYQKLRRRLPTENAVMCKAPCEPPCDRPAVCGGLCSAHYQAKRTGRPIDVPVGMARKSRGACVLCGEPVTARGLCMKHYQQARRSYLIVKKGG